MRAFAIVALLIAAPVNAQDTELKPEKTAGPVWSSSVCEGDGCDAYLPILEKTTRFEDTSARRKWGATLGGLSGVLIGEEVAGVPGAVALGAIGALLGYDNIDRERWEAEAKVYDQAWQRGDDIYYNPAHRLPLVAHWMRAGPSVPTGHANKK